MSVRRQKTISKPVDFSGIGIHTGKQVTMRFVPDEVGRGIHFRRVDLPYAHEIPARVEYVTDTERSTTLGIADVRIHTIEHVLAAVKACQIDNLVIEVSDIEPPVGNGSSDIFVEMLEGAGIVEQEGIKPIIKLTQPVFFASRDIQVIGIPDDCFRNSYTLHYPGSKVLEAQFFTVEITQENFKKELAPCRTFAKFEEIAHLMDRGLIKGGSLANAVIIKDEAIFSKNGLFFNNEMARHKILDMVGDLSLVGYDFCAHIIAIRSGHTANLAFSKELLNQLMREKS